MASFVLVHGAFHGGWCWELVSPLLEAAGHTVVAPNLPGMAGDPTPLDRVTLALCADFTAEIVRAQSAPVILVGHSLGGITISETAERVPDRIAALVYIAALLVPSGVAAMESSKNATNYRGARPSADGISIGYDPVVAQEIFFSKTPAALAAKAAARLTPQPTAPVREPLKLSEARFGRVPRAYVECIEDISVPLTLQREMQAVLPCDPVFALNTDHSPFLSAPQALTDCLLAVAARYKN
jgi:pimeloyl-ACP methyl ester carboxylesterase